MTVYSSSRGANFAGNSGVRFIPQWALHRAYPANAGLAELVLARNGWLYGAGKFGHQGRLVSTACPVPVMTDDTTEHAASAAERTAIGLRKVAMSPQIEETDRPFLLMAALGWDAFARELREPSKPRLLV